MPHLDHVAIWVADLDGARDFYSHWFDGHANGLYENPKTGLRTHILHFAETPADERGTRLEIMTRPELAERRETNALGWAHVSFGLASNMSEAGVPVIDGPRETGDGYYEATVLDPEGNRVELVASDYSDDVALRPAF